MKDEKVTEEKVTEDETIPEFAKDGRDAKLYKLHALMNECVSLARETVEGEFLKDPILKVDNIAQMTCDLAVTLFNKASVPDPNETMLTALERGLEWYTERGEKRKAESAKIEDTFKTAIEDIHSAAKKERFRNPRI